MQKIIVPWKILAGACALMLGGYMLYASLTEMPDADRKWIEKSVQTTGTVTRLRETLRNKARCCYVDIQFVDSGGKERTFSPYDCYSCSAFSAGQAVKVRYSSDNPDTAFIDSAAHDRATSIAVYAMCGLLLLAGLLLLFSAVKGKTDTSQKG